MRAGKDQEAYEFDKWYETACQDSHYDWGDMSLPFLNLHDEDVFEDINNTQRNSEFGAGFSGFAHADRVPAAF